MNSTLSNVIVSYYVSHDDAIRQVNRKTDSFPLPDTYKAGRDGIMDIQEFGVNILEDYGLIDNKERESTVIMFVEPIE